MKPNAVKVRHPVNNNKLTNQHLLFFHSQFSSIKQ